MENKYLKETAMSLNPDGDTETTTDNSGTDNPKTVTDTGGSGGSDGGD
ncbi:hypothetical protein MHM83_02395 [Tenacibaculum sp. Mcav3-52]|nr:hypothetical protein [Tenacibaculum sp. Mcav3-52]MCG7500711.1 hypothetical protein [Tenacibaculum sp. Mcav3-52]GFD78681.1 hypothetical protein KUL118_15430 [Tenacibaculum sp. KUL118]